LAKDKFSSIGRIEDRDISIMAAKEDLPLIRRQTDRLAPQYCGQFLELIPLHIPTHQAFRKIYCVDGVAIDGRG